MNPVFLALGSNIEPRLDYLIKATDRLLMKMTPIKIAPLYETSPYGKTDQPDFLNTALYLETDLAPEDLLAWAKHVEQEVGRIPRERWGPREIDIDIIFYDHLVWQDTHLTIPHPEYARRRFVLQPLVDLAPHWCPPHQPFTLQQLLERCTDTTQVRRIKKNWYRKDGTTGASALHCH